MAKKKPGIIFPRNVYKKGGPLTWSNKVNYSTELVSNETEYKAALKSGFIDNFSEAIFGAAEDIEEDIEGDYEEFQEKEVPVVSESIDDDF